MMTIGGNNMKIKLFHGNVYSYQKDDGTVGIAMYLCDTNLGNKICLIPIEDNDNCSNILEINCLSKVLYPSKFFEIDCNQILSVLRIKKKIVKVEYKTYLQISEVIINHLLSKTSNTYQVLLHQRFQNIQKENYILTEDYYKYLTWFDFKTKLQFEKELKTLPGIKEYSIYWIELGRNIGSELEKLRPALIFKKLFSKKSINDSSLIVIPISSKFTCHKYSCNYPIIINRKINYVKVNDMKRISIKRLARPFLDSTNQPVVLSNQDMNNIKEIIKNYYVDMTI